MATIVHKGINLAYEDEGEGTPAFVFVHGWTCDRSFFAPQAEYFARQHRVVSVDLRGHGESDKPQGEYPIAAYTDDIAYLIKELDLGKVVAVGHSMGGNVVLQLAAAHADCVAAIVLVEPVPIVAPPGMRAAFEAVVEAIEAGNQEPRRQLIANNLFLPTSDRKIMGDVLSTMMAAPSHLAASVLRGSMVFDGPNAAAQCKVPALHLASNPAVDLSPWLPDVVKGVTVGAGHFNMLEVPDQVNGMIEGFLRHYVLDGPGSRAGADKSGKR